MNAIELRIRVLLSMQVALLGAIGKNLRAVVCRWDFNNIRVRSIFDGEISDDDKEIMDEVLVEIISHFPESVVDIECVRSDAPRRLVLDQAEVYVYLRLEN